MATEVQMRTVGNLAESMYWRKPNGWIVVGQAHANAFREYVMRGFQPLEKYGFISAGSGSPDEHLSSADALERLLTLPGGIAEFPPEQIIEYRWHLEPPIEGLKFPQMEGVDVEIFECPECEDTLFFKVTNLVSHLRIRHEWTRRDIQEYGKDTGLDLLPKRVGRRTYRQKETPPERPVADIPVQTGKFTCPVCGEQKFEKTKQGRAYTYNHLRMKHRMKGEDLEKAMGQVKAQEETDG